MSKRDHQRFHGRKNNQSQGGAKKIGYAKSFPLLFFYLDTIFFFMQRSKEECEKDTGEMKGVTTTALDLV